MPSNICRFADYELDRAAYQLRRKGRPVQLERIPLDLLFILADRCGQLVTREEILQRVWGKGVFLDTDNAINTAVRKIRHALHDDSDSPRYITTVPGKGYRFVGEIQTARAVRSREFRARPPRAMVGRDRELTTLLSGLDDTASRHGRPFLISGEPGVGKTRLADEVAAAAEAQGMTLLVGHCSEHYEAVAYLPFVEILENIVDRESNLDRLRKALGEQAQELARLLPKLKNILPELPPPLDLPPAQARRHLFNCFFDFVARVASEQPALMILEDLHWADDSTLSLLDHLTQRLSDLPLMVIGTYRDAELNVSRGLAKTLEGLLRGRLATLMRLKGLPRDELAVMLNGLSGKSPPAVVVNEIFAETKGNPFFVEELFHHLEEENRLYDSSGRFRAMLEISELDAPQSVRLVVARRLARLSDLTQKMLATAAVIGRSISLEILQASSDADADSILEQVEEAEKAGLVFSVAESLKPRYEFAHELTRQAVIGGLSAARRQRLHLEVAEAIERTYSTTAESKYGGSLDDHVAELAHHYSRSSNRPKAAEYLRLAGQQAAQRFANAEAIKNFTSALEILKSLPDTLQRARQELELQTLLGPALIATKGNAATEVGAVYERAVELARQVGEDAQLFPVLFGLRSYHFVRGELRTASELAHQLVSSAESLQDSGLLVEAHLARGNSLLIFGELLPALDHFERAVTVYDPRKHHSHAFLYGLDPGVFCLGRLAWGLTLRGYPDRGLQKAGESIALAHKQAHHFSLAVALNCASTVHDLRRDWPAMQRLAEAAIVLCTEQGFGGMLAQSTMHRGIALVAQGQTQEGIALIQRGSAASQATGAGLFRSHFLTYLSRAFLTAGRFEEGLTAAAKAIAITIETGESLEEAMTLRLKAELLLAQDSSNIAAADRSFREAIEVSRRQGMRLFELEATTSLARLLRDTGRREEARAMLAEIYNWFTEGFDTADLKDAKALLHELSG
jgi:DNA-binding winged helix-turn-helix (wHTH) protein/predicted ATPase